MSHVREEKGNTDVGFSWRAEISRSVVGEVLHSIAGEATSRLIRVILVGKPREIFRMGKQSVVPVNNALRDGLDTVTQNPGLVF